METTNKFTFQGCLLTLLIFSVLFGIVYFLQSGPDCIRIIPDGAVRCECDFKSSDAWDKYKKDTKGAWEAVVMDIDPCKK